jgi:hypothetical protein
LVYRGVDWSVGTNQIGLMSQSNVSSSSSSASASSTSSSSAVATAEMEPVAPPFDADTHIRSPDMTPEQLAKVQELRSMLEHHHLYVAYRRWCTDSQLQRFLIARLWNLKPAHDLVILALTWRSTRIPVGGVESLPNWEETMKNETDTGKMYINGYDQYQRPVIVFDNSVQNTNNVDTQLVALAFNLDTACRMMDAKRTDKYVVFMNLEIFSMFNCPPMKVAGVHLLCCCALNPALNLLGNQGDNFHALFWIPGKTGALYCV